MQTLIPQPASANAAPTGRLGRALGFGLTPLTLALITGGCVLAIPAFWHPHRIIYMFAWDALVLLIALIDAARLPAPERLHLTRTFLSSPQLGEATRLEHTVQHDASFILNITLTDDLHPALTAHPTAQHLEAFPREQATTQLTIYPTERGDVPLGRIFLSYSSPLRLAERWASALPTTPLQIGFPFRSAAEESAVPPATNPALLGRGFSPAVQPSPKEGALAPEAIPQRIRIFPAHDDASGGTELFLLRARQLERQKRRLRLRGTGRDFESLRDYAEGDELRNISWTATARRGKLVTRQFTVERSQQVWLVLDAGRLSRTALELRRDASIAEHTHETAAEREAAHSLTVSQLDEATTAATMLAQVISGSGDKFALMAYGRAVQQLLPPGAGAVHMRLLIDLLSQTRSEPSEADHLNAIARLKTQQRRRGLIIWITELVDQAGRPELVAAATDLTRRHLVLLVLLEHPELEQLAAGTPKTRDDMFRIAAAEEMLQRRRETVAQLERSGVLIVQTTAAEAGARAINKYLEIKARGQL